MTIEQNVIELKSMLTEQKTIHTEMKAQLTKQQEQLDGMGGVEAEQKQRIETLNDQIGELQAKMDAKHAEIKAAMNRRAAGSDNKPEIKSLAKYDKVLDAAMRSRDIKGNAALAEAQRAVAAEIKELGEKLGGEYKAMSVDSNPDGGYFVTPDMSGRIATKVFETSPMRQYASVMTTSSDTVTGYRDFDEPGSGWEGERTNDGNDDTPEIGKWDIPVHFLRARLPVTAKLLADSSVDIQTYLGGHVARKFARSEAAAFVRGNGINKPRGYLTLPAGTGTGQIEQVTVGSNAATVKLTYSGLVDLVYSLKGEYRQGAVFAAARLSIAEMRKIVDNDGRPQWQPAIAAGQPSTFLDHAVAEFNDMDAIAENALAVGFGNFGVGYQIVDRAGISVLVDPFTQEPMTKFVYTKRVGGDVVNEEAIKLGIIGA